MTNVKIVEKKFKLNSHFYIFMHVKWEVLAWYTAGKENVFMQKKVMSPHTVPAHHLFKKKSLFLS